MGKPRLIAGIDVGSTKICALVAEPVPSGLNLLAASAVAASGIQRGAVADLEAAAAAIDRSLEQVAADCSSKIGGVLLAVGTEVVSVNSRGTAFGPGSDTALTADDARKAIAAAVEGSLPATRQVIHAIPRSFSIDGRGNIANPAGLFGRRIDAEVHLVTTSSASVRSLVTCIERHGATVEEVVAKPLAAAEAVLGPKERELGVAVADLGGGTSALTIFVEGAPWHTATLPIGGKHLTQDIAIVLGIGHDVAEELKLSAGHADPLSLVDHELEIPAVDEGPPSRVSRRHLCAVIEARVLELLAMIRDEIDRSGYSGLLPAGLVLTGGTAQLPGIARVAGEVLGMRVRVGQSDIGASAGLAGPAYAGAIGLLLWRMHDAQRWWAAPAPVMPPGVKPGRTSRASRWLRAAWPPLSGFGGSENRG